jgi:hypothetical protein
MIAKSSESKNISPWRFSVAPMMDGYTRLIKSNLISNLAASVNRVVVRHVVPSHAASAQVLHSAVIERSNVERH